ncbi:mechanosensitive ion channel family protein [Pseudooceanicola sp.]|uniref:mechanosensitive ion channel family protein n=1 Tax=Pseudooceanicola sp. TaxID=1914328 RepID=UPI00261E36E7|nr:mechanosensitive ion channel family protein [Pseudooceanicola sp.]MDF1857076.1 mechanosensitive ion channel family protein [Pseudooceanicola sp.]
MFRFLVLPLILASLLLPITPLPLTAQTNTEETNQPSGKIEVEDDRGTDAAIANRIRAILHEIGGYEDVTVTVAAGIVTLRGEVLTAADAAQLNVIVARVEGVVAIRNQVSETTDVVRRLDPAIDRFVARMTQFVAYLPLLAVSCVAFLLVVLVGVLLARMKQPWERLAPNAFIADIYRQVLRLSFGIAGIVVALDILNATALLSTILGAAGIIGLAIGFAVRDTVENFIASVMLSVRQPFRPNDAVEINGDEGKVIRLTSRATILLSWDGNHIRIPNSTVFKSRIVNYSRNIERRFCFDLGLAPDADLARAVQVAQDTLVALPFTLNSPAPNAWIDAVGDSTVSLRLIGWINQNQTSLLAARGEAIRLSIAALTEAGIAMPEPTYRVVGANLAKPAKPAAAAVSAPEALPINPEETLDVQAHAEHELEAIVDEERRSKGDEDLLTREARTE